MEGSIANHRRCGIIQIKHWDIYQVKSLIQSIRLTNQNLLIAVDHEGGRVQRFKKGA
jgi:beta-glucosidase-like glycosyl hydrolase